MPACLWRKSKKSIAALHKAAAEQGLPKLLEVSTKSPQPLGVAYSGFNLSLPQEGGAVPVECAFQGSKIFAQGGSYTDIYHADPVAAKRDARLQNSGALLGYRWGGEDFPLNPPGAFYDWLYIRAAAQNSAPSRELLHFSGFTDLEINIKKRAACQAFSAALYVSLVENNCLQQAMADKTAFLQLGKPAYEAKAAVKYA
ncbi:MAG: hypothetical protein DU429_06900 [Candidatus Tokpelaia sp.]|nr:MAG: hypothetical protein DU429_06900 [Candidatus Tokpelaia sp.]KAA6206187.1 MAG: hypothetical protein DU430_02225 [Candidatus Tokpelaia sp.]